MRHCQDGQLFAVPQFNRSSPVSPSHNNTADTAADATPYGLNGDAKIEPCNQCLSSWQIRGSSHHGNDVVGGENGHASCDYSSSTLAKVRRKLLWAGKAVWLTLQEWRGEEREQEVRILSQMIKLHPIPERETVSGCGFFITV